ncbi:MAG: helix-turn-helix transcriptional regulator [Bacteroidales bacterium]|nr:helix-turn-helix transcriptional regulator [Bacteroidales bacterium]
MDTVNSRIQQFLNMEGVSPAQLADQLGIQRSGLSHLLSGRNKPSFDFITKLLSSYPNLQADWLLLGRGKPYKEAVSPAPMPEIFEIEPIEDLPEEEPVQPAIEDNYPEKEDVKEEIPVSQPRENPVFASRTISRITIFYSDGTFEEH